MTEAEWQACNDSKHMLTYLGGRVSQRKARLTLCACLRRFWGLLTDQRSRSAVMIAEQLADGAITRDEVQVACAEARAAFQSLYQTHISGHQVLRTFYGGCVSAAQIAARVLEEGPFSFRHIGDALWIATCAFPLESTEDLGRRAAHFNAVLAAGRIEPGQLEDLLFGGPEGKAWRNRGMVAVIAEKAAQTTVLRELFGNPFRPVAINPTRLLWKGGTVVKLAQAIYEERAFDRLPILADALEDAGCTDPLILDHCRQPGEHVRGCWVVDALLGKE
jgi:hypothetical protein